MSDNNNEQAVREDAAQTGVNQYREQRIKHLEALAELGYSPFGRAFERTARLSDLREPFEEGREVTAAGRLTSIRSMGKSVFADLNDGSAKMQLYVGKKNLGDDPFKAFGLLDIGDHVGVKGTLFVTRTGEKTIQVAEWTLLSKAVLQPPERNLI